MTKQAKLYVVSRGRREGFPDVEQAALWCVQYPAPSYRFEKLDKTPLLAIKGHKVTFTNDDWWMALEDYERDFIGHLLDHLKES